MDGADAPPLGLEIEPHSELRTLLCREDDSGKTISGVSPATTCDTILEGEDTTDVFYFLQWRRHRERFPLEAETN